MSVATLDLAVRTLGLSDYADTRRSMRRYTESRDDASRDELWLLEHPRIYTFGQAGRREHLLDAGGIPVIDSDRGGQVTYHGPGQLVAYVLMDLRRRRLGVRHLVEGLEQCVIDMLAEQGIAGERRERAPGVYVSGRKICALGLRIRNGCSYHGLALNVNMDLEPFQRIDPCGFAGLEVTQTRDLGIPWSLEDAGKRLTEAFVRQFAYRAHRDLVSTA
jgi:lipoyl(octanoyl) transferase